MNGKLLAIVLILSIAGPAMFLASPALGDTNAEPAESLAVSQPTATTYSQVSAGGTHRCALRTDQSIVCWGNNENGQTDAPEGQFTAIAAGRYHSCAINDNGTIECWGDNQFGQTDAPEGQFTAISADQDHSCGIRGDGTAECWGLSFYRPTNTPGDG